MKIWHETNCLQSEAKVTKSNQDLVKPTEVAEKHQASPYQFDSSTQLTNFKNITGPDKNCTKQDLHTRSRIKYRNPHYSCNVKHPKQPTATTTKTIYHSSWQKYHQQEQTIGIYTYKKNSLKTFNIFWRSWTLHLK